RITESRVVNTPFVLRRSTMSPSGVVCSWYGSRCESTMKSLPAMCVSFPVRSVAELVEPAVMAQPLEHAVGAGLPRAVDMTHSAHPLGERRLAVAHDDTAQARGEQR